MKHRHKIERITSVDGKNYKLILLKEKTAKNLHHILSRKNKEYEVDSKDNKMMVPEIGHDNLNRFFGNRQMPHLQLKYLLEEWGWNNVLSEGVRKELYGLLSLPRELFYKEKLVKDKHKGKSLFSDDSIYKDKI